MASFSFLKTLHFLSLDFEYGSVYKRKRRENIGYMKGLIIIILWSFVLKFKFMDFLKSLCAIFKKTM